MTNLYSTHPISQVPLHDNSTKPFQTFNRPNKNAITAQRHQLFVTAREIAGAFALIYYVSEKCRMHTATGQTTGHRCDVNAIDISLPNERNTVYGNEKE